MDPITNRSCHSFILALSKYKQNILNNSEYDQGGDTGWNSKYNDDANKEQNIQAKDDEKKKDDDTSEDDDNN